MLETWFWWWPNQYIQTELILDTYFYEVEFPGDEIRKSAANIIEESMYSQYGVDRNKHLLLDRSSDMQKVIQLYM